MEERMLIQLGLEQGGTRRATARRVPRSPSTIARELKRNGWTNPATESSRRGRPRVAGGYRATAAQTRASKSAATPRGASRLARDSRLWPGVEDLSRLRHSLEQTAGIRRRMHPHQPSLQVSRETICTAIYTVPCGELRSEPIACSRQSPGRPLRSPGAAPVNSDCMQIFIDEIASRYPDDNVVMVLDGAGWHKSQTLHLPDHLRQ